MNEETCKTGWFSDGHKWILVAFDGGLFGYAKALRFCKRCDLIERVTYLPGSSAYNDITWDELLSDLRKDGWEITETNVS